MGWPEKETFKSRLEWLRCALNCKGGSPCCCQGRVSALVSHGAGGRKGKIVRCSLGRDELGITGDAAVKVSTRLWWFPRSEFPMETYEGHYTKKDLKTKLGYLKSALGEGGAGRLVALFPGVISALLWI